MFVIVHTHVVYFITRERFIQVYVYIKIHTCYLHVYVRQNWEYGLNFNMTAILRTQMVLYIVFIVLFIICICFVIKVNSRHIYGIPYQYVAKRNH